MRRHKAPVSMVSGALRRNLLDLWAAGRMIQRRHHDSLSTTSCLSAAERSESGLMKQFWLGWLKPQKTTFESERYYIVLSLNKETHVSHCITCMYLSMIYYAATQGFKDVVLGCPAFLSIIATLSAGKETVRWNAEILALFYLSCNPVGITAQCWQDFFCPRTHGLQRWFLLRPDPECWGNPSIFRKISMMLGIGLCPGFPRAIPVAKYSKDHAMTAFHSISRISSIFWGWRWFFHRLRDVQLLFALFPIHITGPFVLQVPPPCDCHFHWFLGHVANPFPWLVAQDRWHTEPAAHAAVLGRHGAVHEQRTVLDPNDFI